MGTLIDWDELIERAYYALMLAEDGSEEERQAEQELRRIQAVALHELGLGGAQ